MNNNIVKFLIKLKNASLYNKNNFKIKSSKEILRILSCLYREGFIQSYFFISKETLSVFLRYSFNKSVLKNLKLLSTPSRSRHLSYKDLLQINIKKSVFFLSTSKGFFTHTQCKALGIGGEVFFIIE